MKTNENGLTFRAWLAAARQTASIDTRKAWRAGEDPTEWAADTCATCHWPTAPGHECRGIYGS